MTVVQRLVYVSGAPGSGKSTLAGPLAAELGYALLAKDTIKETLHGVLGPPDLDRSRSRELGAASMELLWAIAALSPQVMIEANFRPYSDYERDKLTALGGLQVEVHCACPPDLAIARYSARPRHPVHVQTTLTPDDIAQYDRPVGIGTLVTVDTTTPVDVPALAAQLRFLLLSSDGKRSWMKRLLYECFSSARKIVSMIFFLARWRVRLAGILAPKREVGITLGAARLEGLPDLGSWVELAVGGSCARDGAGLAGTLCVVGYVYFKRPRTV